MQKLNNRPLLPVNGRTRKRISVVMFDDTANELAAFCNAHNIRAYAVLDTVLRDFLHADTEESRQRLTRIATTYPHYKAGRRSTVK